VSYSKNIGVFSRAVGDLGEGWDSRITRKLEDVTGVLDDYLLG
jgi:hypothetical protein